MPDPWTIIGWLILGVVAAAILAVMARFLSDAIKRRQQRKAAAALRRRTAERLGKPEADVTTIDLAAQGLAEWTADLAAEVDRTGSPKH